MRLARLSFPCLSVAILSVGLAGCNASPPSSFETRTVAFAKHHIFIGNKAQKNPLPNTPENWADGKEAFSHYCVACHGMDGQNTGVPFVDHISPPIPSLASDDVQRRRPVEVDPGQRNQAFWNARVQGNTQRR
jgi:cytochrome c553